MTANIDPIFPRVPNIGLVQIATANSNRDGTGTLGTAFTAGSDGSRIEKAYLQTSVTTTAGMVRVFLNDGTNTHLIDEILIPAVTVSATVAGFHAPIPILDGMVLPSGWSVKVSTEKAEAINVVVVGGNY